MRRDWHAVRGPRRHLFPITASVALMVLSATVTAELTIKNHYSPHNRERPKRQSTRYIILHTTEGPSSGALEKLHARGEAHYVVDEAGVVYRLIDRRRVALHAGRSMWAGRTNIDDVSLGIEVAGYHNRDLTTAQYTAVRELVEELQRIYSIPDERVLTHSMVAYGAPNKWHKSSHRGRKRCGMLFARDHVRSKLGLAMRPSFDPDVRAGRLTIGDPYLESVLYGKAVAPSPARSDSRSDDDGLTVTPKRSAWDIAREQYNLGSTTYVLPDGRRVAGNTKQDWKKIPP
ncbi:MAG: N-acetylmuramoyl-L-alanine amidase, partial [Verrucomicrobia bacterium]|nr:N-acetylmuramoyl-L-alanine amidase [Verrucomicrobiota bacterium]